MRSAVKMLRGADDRAETFHYHVDSASGNDSNAGSKSAPYLTVGKALSVATAGKSIGLKRGSVFRPGSALAPTVKLRLGAYGAGANPVLSGGSLVTGWTQGVTGGATEIQRIVSAAPSSASTLVLSVTATTTIGNFVVMAGKMSGGIAPSSVTDSRGNTWTIDKTAANVSGARSFVASAKLTTALQSGDTVTVTPASSTSGGFAVFEYSGISASPADQNAAGSGTSTAASAGPTSATAQANELAVTVVSSGSNLSGLTQPTGYTLRDTGLVTNSVQMAEQVLTSTGAQTATWTNPNVAWSCVLQTYKSGAVTGTNTYSATLASSPSFVTSTASGVTTPLTLGASATTLSTNQYFWASTTLYVNLGGTDPGTVTIEAATSAVFSLTVASNAADGLVCRNVQFHHGSDRSVHIANNSYFVFDRCDFAYTGFVSNSGTISINDCGTSTRFARVTRCIFHDLQNDGCWWTNIHSLQIDHNTFSKIGALPADVQSDCMQIYLGAGATADGTWIHHNTSDMTGTTSPKGHITISGGSDLTGGIVEWNTMTAGSTGINMNAGAMIVRNNTATGQAGSSYSMGPDVWTNTGIQFYRNLAYATHSGLTFYGPNGNTVTNILVANNTIVDPSFCGIDISCASITGTMVNNLVWAQTVTPSFIIRYSPTGAGSTLAPDYNDYSTVTNGWKYASTTYSTLATWRAAATADAHSITSDPLFTNPSTRDYSLAPNSPARNAGVAASPATDGFSGAAPNIGYII